MMRVEIPAKYNLICLISKLSFSHLSFGIHLAYNQIEESLTIVFCCLLNNTKLMILNTLASFSLLCLLLLLLSCAYFFPSFRSVPFWKWKWCTSTICLEIVVNSPQLLFCVVVDLLFYFFFVSCLSLS